jgi:ADP-heptose:LPS heptosyltransferase
MDRILVSRTDGIGDLLLTTPLFYELRRKYPYAHISALVSPYASELLINNPAVDDILKYYKNRHRTLLDKLKSEKYDAVLAVYPRPDLAWLFLQAGIPVRCGTSSRWYSVFYNRRVKMSRKRSEKHEADYDLMLARELLGGVKAEKEYYYITPQEILDGKDYLKKKDIKGDFIIVHPGSKGSAWNLNEIKYGELVTGLINAGFQLLLTGGPSEKPMLSRIREASWNKNRLFIMDEELKLREFAAVISAAKAVISCSTGPMHIAAALGVKTLSFFPHDDQTSMKPLRWSPLGNMSCIIQPAFNDESSLNDLECDFMIAKLIGLLEKK